MPCTAVCVMAILLSGTLLSNIGGRGIPSTKLGLERRTRCSFPCLARPVAFRLLRAQAFLAS